MLVIAVEFRIKAPQAEAFLARVQRQAADSLEQEPECHRFDVAVDPQDAARIFLYELYDDDAAFARHLESAHFRDFDAETGDWVEEKTVSKWTLLPALDDPS